MNFRTLTFFCLKGMGCWPVIINFFVHSLKKFIHHAHWVVPSLSQRCTNSKISYRYQQNLIIRKKKNNNRQKIKIFFKILNIFKYTSKVFISKFIQVFFCYYSRISKRLLGVIIACNMIKNISLKNRRRRRRK